MPQGQIRKALSGFYYVYKNGVTYQTRGRGNFRNRNITPLVGDQVIFESENLTDGYLLEILPRKNELIRPQIANVDQGIVITSCVEPQFSFNLLDRFLITLEYALVKPIIFITKTDLLDKEAFQQMKKIQKNYEKIGYTFLLPKREDRQEGVRELERCFPERSTVFMGQSGAGKSTLLNAISPELQLKTAAISESLGRGKHTTRHVELLPLYDGLVADTPGFSAIDFLEMEASELSKQFPEFVRASASCKFRECLHRREPGCKVKEEVETGEIMPTRYENYLQFLNEIEKRKPVYGKNKK